MQRLETQATNLDVEKTTIGLSRDLGSFTFKNANAQAVSTETTVRVARYRP